jgi:hypothetical protein
MSGRKTRKRMDIYAKSGRIKRRKRVKRSKKRRRGKRRRRIEQVQKWGSRGSPTIPEMWREVREREEDLGDENEGD